MLTELLSFVGRCGGTNSRPVDLPCTGSLQTALSSCSHVSVGMGSRYFFPCLGGHQLYDMRILQGPYLNSVIYLMTLTLDTINLKY